MGGFLRRLLRNLGSLLLAMLLAVVVWITATLATDPVTPGTYSNVRIQTVNQPPDTILFEPISEEAAVVARAPRSVLADLRATDFEAVMDLSIVRPGTPAIVPVKVTTANEGVRIEEWNPTEQTVHLETVRTITLPVAIEALGDVATGYQSSNPVVSPDRIALRGPDPFLANVASVSGSVNVDGARSNVLEEVRVRPLDADGRVVSGVEWNPGDVEVRVAVRKRRGFKPEVEVVPDLRGEPAPGYRRGSVEVQPSTVTLAGLPSVLDALPGFVETDPISVISATQDLVVRTPLTVPQNVVVVGVDFVTVTVEVLPILSSRAMTATIEIRGVNPGWVASASPVVVDVILEGPDALLADMASGDLRVILDVFGLGLGTHRVEPDVLAPEGVSVVSIIPETIEVVIAPGPTPTPSPTLTPTLTVTPTLTTTP
jgi:YbbR domain-containing protein